MNYPYKAAAFAARNRNHAYDAVINALELAAQAKGMTRRDIADAIGRKPSQVSAWLSGPSNWTLDTVSDLLWAVGATMDYSVTFNEDRPKENIYHPAAVAHVAGMPTQTLTLPQVTSVSAVYTTTATINDT